MVESLGVFGRYRLESRLGAGGMGEVFGARDAVLGRRVAVKLIAPELASGPGARRRFERECRLAAAIDHPHVIPVYEAGECDGRLFLAMRYVEGVDLHTLTAGLGGLAVERAVAIVCQVASALDAIHARGLVHRDVKPGNVLIAQVDGADHAYLCDFGLAAALSQPSRGATQTGEFIGTLGFIAPEQLRRERVDHRADIYGLGCVLFEALTGRGPFDGLGAAAMVAAALMGPTPSLLDLGVEVPAALDRVVTRATARDPDNRFASSGELAATARAAIGTAHQVPRAYPRRAEQADGTRGSLTLEDGGKAKPGVAIGERTDSRSRASRLPAAPTPTIGRRREIAAVCELFSSSGARLVTLAGPGGVGKTRVALNVAHALAPAMPDGACWVELAGLAQAENVASTIAGSLALAPLQGESIGEALSRHLADRRMLLVIDNFEHVLDAAVLVADLLASSPGLIVLTTSREALDLTAEHLVVIPPLATPGVSAAVSVADVESTDASVLFVAAARRRDESLQVTSDTAPILARICARLEGLPLSLELAAARAGTLGLGELATRLEQSLGDLGLGPRDAPARHQTLRATIEWSYCLLDHEQARAFVQFAVFAGGANLDAAQAVTGATAATFEALVAKSLINRRFQAGGSSRFVMLETIREYALELLGRDPNQGRVRRRHAEWLVEFVKQAQEHLQSTDQAKWFSRFRDEIDNLRAVLDWSLENDTRAGVELVPPLWRVWLMNGQLHELIAWLERALANPTTTDLRTRAICLREYGGALDSLGKYGRAWEALQESLKLFRELGDRKCEADVLLGLSVVARNQGSPHDALALAKRALASLRELGDRWLTAQALHMMGEYLRDTRDFQRASATLEEARAMFTDLGDRYMIVRTAHSDGDLALDQSDAARAKSLYRQGLTAAIEIGEQLTQYYCTAGLACVAALSGDVCEAGRLWGVAETTEKRLETPMHAPDRKRYLRILAPLTEDPRFQEGQQAGRDLPLAQAVHDLISA